MLQLIAAIPTLFNAINTVSELFTQGKATVQTVTSNVSQASTPEELRTEIDSLTANEQSQWASMMSNQIDAYTKQNERLVIDSGAIDTNITNKISIISANKIAELRMTTRPWAVRLMVHYVLFPFYLIIVDLIQKILVTWLPFLKNTFGIEPFNAFEYAFGVLTMPASTDETVMLKLMDVFATKGITPATLAGQLYMESIPWVVSIILGYMGLREVGKVRGNKDEQTTTMNEKLSNVAPLITNIQKWFKKG